VQCGRDRSSIGAADALAAHDGGPPHAEDKADLGVFRNTLIAPFTPPGTIAALDLILPSSELSSRIPDAENCSGLTWHLGL